MRSIQVRTRALRTAAPIVDIAALYASAQRSARRRTLDGWLAVATAALLGTFVAAFAWYVLNPAMKTLLSR